MQLDVGNEPPFRLAFIKCIDKQLDLGNRGYKCMYSFLSQYTQTDELEQCAEAHHHTQGAKLLSFRVSGTPKNMFGNPIF